MQLFDVSRPSIMRMFILVSEGRILSDLEQLEDLDRIVQETEG